ncbi:hypothetical protein DCAR_0728498 [Daucus carota subsp. sativus]|uniref:RING-type domain-containing protein n=2 Tax=Daucus carota subsp. sativus TaxID=79200 RepID=A0AAF0XJ51_DAUCS|nr:hypothetical protein DCAR_0728498 [Daucus carota subsp. sativus]
MHQPYQISTVHSLSNPPEMSTAKNSSSEHWHYSQLQDDNFEFHGRAIFFLLLLFSILLLIILLFFYARWFCRYLPITRAAANEAHAPPPHGVDDKVYLSLPVVLYGVLKKEISVVECCICIGVFEEQDKVKVLPVCGHYFHSECVDRWLSTQSSCPICRAHLRVDSPV